MMLSRCCLTRPHVTQGSAQDGQSIEGCHGGALVSLGPPTGTCYGCSGAPGVLCVTFWVFPYPRSMRVKDVRSLTSVDRV